MPQHTPEFFKLDSTDRKVLFWMMDHNAKSLMSWIQYIADHFIRNRAVTIDAEKLFKEVIIEFPEEENLRNGKTWRPKSILLVDDETIFNSLHTRILQLTRVTRNIQQALNEAEAIELLKTNMEGKLPDIILLYLAKSAMDGCTFIEVFKLLELPGNDQISIIVLTSSIDQRDRLKTGAMGITHYLVKLVDKSKLCVAVINQSVKYRKYDTR